MKEGGNNLNEELIRISLGPLLESQMERDFENLSRFISFERKRNSWSIH